MGLQFHVNQPLHLSDGIPNINVKNDALFQLKKQ
jgi:hypothetical protein